ncbi:hypothetical protein BOTBODRAFT_26226 [Botryobasidium botryosum FD-172 SS1]|uniref:NmrA-like domain-containing protein n=1 Tax=Botryobasidium botryosum (strain FD-172 SS1) TaxID=930990 RepID=A0A067N4F6_BOTB1|nr:hypothetical protein BOTBODRAFT_26226 [Botryobasidium botryosum FD-172 SS1]
MTPSKNSILVLGAGELGMHVLRELSKPRWGHHDIAVLLRPSTIDTTNEQKRADITELRKLGIRLLPGDLVAQSASELAELFAGYDTVIGCTGFAAGPGVQLKVTQAALQAGVPRWFPWQFGVDYDALGKGSAQDLFDEQLDVRALLRAQTRTEWVIVSTGVFTSFLFDPSFNVVDFDAGVVHALGSWDNRITVTTVEDIARLTAEIIHAEPKFANEVVYTAGDTCSYAQVADIVDSILESKGRPKAERIVWDLPTLREGLRQNPDDTCTKYRDVFAHGKGAAWDMEQTFNYQRGIPVVSAKEWAQKNL